MTARSRRDSARAESSASSSAVSRLAPPSPIIASRAVRRALSSDACAAARCALAALVKRAMPALIFFRLSGDSGAAAASLRSPCWNFSYTGSWIANSASMPLDVASNAAASVAAVCFSSWASFARTSARILT